MWIVDLLLWIVYYPYVIFHKVLEVIFGSSARVNILRILFNSPQPLSGRQVGELAELTHKGAIHALKTLVDLGAVRQRKVGKAYQYSLLKNNVFVEKIIIPCIKKEASLYDELKGDIKRYFGKDTVSLILYGSFARGKEMRGSDIDIIAVVKDEREKIEVEEKAASKVSYFRERFNSLLSLHCFTPNEIKGKKNMPLIKSVIKEGIVLSGKPLKDIFK
jgi:predicted nucleotidyltransferase